MALLSRLSYNTSGGGRVVVDIIDDDDDDDDEWCGWSDSAMVIM
jgi:hypothetical protein